MESKNTGENRKVIFLHPQAVVQDELARALITENFEAYLLRNHVSVKSILRDFPNAIVLIQVDSGLEDLKWIEFADDLKANPLYSQLTLCVLSVSSMEEIKKTYLEASEAFSDGFTYGKYNFAATYKIIREMLEREKANPPGFVIRGTSPDTLKISVVFNRDSIRYEGLLKDISISGLTCRIETVQPLYPSEIPIHPIIITRGDTQFVVGGRIVGNSGTDDSMHLILFDDTVAVDKKEEIYGLIHACLQARIESRIIEKSKTARLVTKPPRSQLYRK